MSMTEYKVSSNDLGHSLFYDFVLPFHASFYNKVSGSKKDEIMKFELLVVCVWLVFYFLNVAGNKYEKTANSLSNTFFQYYKKNISSAKLTPLSGDDFFKLLNVKFDQFKDNFQSGDKNMNFERLAMVASDYILNSNKPNIDIFFSFKLGTALQELAISLADILKMTELTD